MPRRYFQLTDDLYLPGRWELGTVVDQDGEEVWPHLFRQGEPIQLDGRLKVAVDTPGRPLDFSHAAFSIPILHVRVASLLAERASTDVQLLPIDVDNQPDQYLALNATHLIRCIDDERSTEVRYWKPEDGMPEKTGTYFSVAGLRITPASVGDAQVFRTWGWTGALIVSEDLKTALEQAKATGVRFTEV
ncbi:imm11 family protein [Pyxidicoccus sp. 3LG]